jgi:2-oxoglutarate dehydrogenase E2 component (dihydrolipoamide succinyltransferase)
MSSLTDILLPADQSEGTTNTVGKWFKAVGDRVTANEPLIEITTDKVTLEIAAPADGELVAILKAEGDPVEPGESLGQIGPVGSRLPATGSEAAPPVATATGSGAPAGARTAELPRLGSDVPTETELSPAVRRLLKERGLDPGSVTGTGRGGRITVEDVERAAAARSTPGSPAAGAGRMVPHTSMRKSIAAHMVQSVATAPHVTTVFEADLSAILAHRAAGPAAKPTLTAYFVRASVEALRAVPEVNSRWHDHGLELFDDANIGIGTALEAGGLIVPVIHRAQTLDLFQIAERLQELTGKARAGQLSPKDVQGGTFTISNHGVSGSLIATPIIINQPQSAILGVGKLQRRPVVSAGGTEPSDQLTVKPMVYVTLTIDHRVLDGFQANTFLTKWVETIERWPG